MSDAPNPLVTATVTAQPIPEGFSVPGAVALAKDLAINMYEVPLLLKKHGITPEQYATLEKIPYFQAIVKQQAEEWNTPKNSQQRLATQASAGLEEVLPDVIARTKVKNEPLAGIAQLVKVLADIAGASGNTRQQAPPTEKFRITINLGGDQEVYEKSKLAVTLESEPVALPTDVQPKPPGFGSLLTLSPEPEQA